MAATAADMVVTAVLVVDVVATTVDMVATAVLVVDVVSTTADMAATAVVVVVVVVVVSTMADMAATAVVVVVVVVVVGNLIRCQVYKSLVVLTPNERHRQVDSVQAVCIVAGWALDNAGVANLAWRVDVAVGIYLGQVKVV